MQDKVCLLNLVSEYVKSSLICVQSAKLNHAKLIRPHSVKPRCAMLNGHKCSQKKEQYILALMHKHYMLFTIPVKWLTMWRRGLPVSNM